MIPLGVLASRRESSPPIEFVGASATAFPTHAVGDLLFAAGWAGYPLSQPSGWLTAYNDNAGAGVFYRFATVTNTGAPSLNANVSKGFLVYRGANATTPIGATSGAENMFPALTLQDNGGSSWVLCAGISTAGMPTSVSGMERRIDDPPWGAYFDTNGGVSSFTAKTMAETYGISIEIRGG